MARITIKQQIAGYYCLTLILGLVLFLLLTFTFFLFLWLHLDPRVAAVAQVNLTVLLITACIGSSWLVSLRVVGVAIWYLVRPEKHPVLVGLARYGRLEDLLQEIEQELADASSHRRIAGTPWWCFEIVSELDGDTVLITKSWLIYRIKGNLVDRKFFRLDSLVLVYPEHNKVVLADRHGVRLEIYGTETGRARLLAEILARVPWALDHFDPGTEKTWQENRQAILNQVEQRRQTIQQERQIHEGGQENG